MIYGEANKVQVPNIDLLSFLFDSKECRAKDDSPLHAEASNPENVITKSEVRSLTKKFAHFLRESYGIGRHGAGKDIITVLSTGQSRLAPLFYGIVAAEGVYSAASALAGPGEIVRQIQKSQSKLLVCSQETKPLASAVAEEAGIPTSRILVLESYPESRLYSLDGSSECDFQKSLAWPVITDESLLRNRLTCLIYSSGTTGPPKAVKISHSNMVSQCYIPSVWNRPVWDTWEEPLESRTLAHLGASHISAIQGYLVNPFFDGGLVFWMPKFDFLQFVQYNQALRITTFFTMPFIYMAIAKQPFVTDQFKSLRLAYCGGSSLDKEMAAAVSLKLGGGKTVLVQNWGMTEATGAVTHMPPDRRDTTGAISTLLPNITMRLVDEECRDVAPNEPGEALLKGPFISQGYHEDPKADREIFTADGWMRTGDILQVDGDLLYLVDRKKDIIKAPTSVSPSEVEGVLLSHPSIADAAVRGVFSEDRGHALVRGYIVAKAGFQDQLSKVDVHNFMKERLSDVKCLHGGIHFVQGIPRNALGKIQREKLEDLDAK